MLETLAVANCQLISYNEGPLGGGEFRAGSIRFSKSQWWFQSYGSFGPKPTLNANAQPKDTKLLVKAITGL